MQTTLNEIPVHRKDNGSWQCFHCLLRVIEYKMNLLRFFPQNFLWLYYILIMSACCNHSTVSELGIVLSEHKEVLFCN